MIYSYHNMSDQDRKDELKAEEYYERKSTTDNNKSDLSPSSSPRTKGIKDKIVGKISSTTISSTTTGKSQEENNVNLSESARVSNNVRTVTLGLFALIGFIILVFAVFTASIGAQLNQVQFANSVFIAAIVGAFTLVGVIVYQIHGSNGR
jgi:Mg2+ and Co2+ transporter CorA